jgi:2,4-dienoyl-CoA reductase (NADPH2)
MEADTVVVAAGSISHNPLGDLVKEMGVECQVIGDANRVATAFDAVHGGYRAALKI